MPIEPEILSAAKNDTPWPLALPVLVVKVHYRRCPRSIGPTLRYTKPAPMAPTTSIP
ncbi:MAG TPA: hypothetical protein VFA09_27240 [Ktedonobacteraceae bacterium]|nr:hypothetical protein [Ktedonobacteraceae bacterium]